MARTSQLSSDDVAALKALVLHADCHLSLGSRDSAYRAELRRLEAKLSPIAREFWFATPSERFRHALSTFVRSFQNVKTTRGWTAYRYIKRRRSYASRPCATGLDAPLEGWTPA